MSSVARRQGPFVAWLVTLIVASACGDSSTVSAPTASATATSVLEAYNARRTPVPTPSATLPPVIPTIAEFQARVRASLDPDRSFHLSHVIDCGGQGQGPNAYCYSTTMEGFFNGGASRTSRQRAGESKQEFVKIPPNCWKRLPDGTWQQSRLTTGAPGECLAITPVYMTFNRLKRVLGLRWQYNPDATPSVQLADVDGVEAFSLSFRYTESGFSFSARVEAHRQTFDLLRWTEIDRNLGANTTETFRVVWNRVLPIQPP